MTPTREHADTISRRRPARIYALALPILALAATALVGILAGPSLCAAAGVGGEARPRTVAERGPLTADELATIDLFERASKSVVYVAPMIKRVQRTLFGYRDVIQTGTGSGFVWDEDGHIITNYHVIRNAAACAVSMPDNETYEAELVGVLPEKDIAVIRIDAPRSKLAPIAIGRSNDLRVGQNVYAIGNPYGFDFTLTSGIVSALNRQMRSFENRTIQDVIQTDSAINPGNSGGPLLDSAGRLIGMNTMIFSESGSSAGIGFAIPIDTINRVVPELIAYGKIIRPGLGVELASDRINERFRLEGVMIIEVREGSPAARAGLRGAEITEAGRVIPGDVIIRIGDYETPNMDALLNALERYKVGDQAHVTVKRANRTLSYTIELVAAE